MPVALHDFRRENPVFIDLETHSGCDLKAAGGWNYAAHGSTRLLTVSWSDEPDVFHLWFPWHDRREISHDMIATHLSDAVVHFGEDVPAELLAVRDRPWYAHNAWTFDRLVWESTVGDTCRPARWGDTYPLALACGLPGGLNNIGKRLWGEGKYEAGNQIAKTATRVTDKVRHPAQVPAGHIVMVARYNVQDVRLLTWLWDEIVATLRLPEDEYATLMAHDAINSRGVRVDADLLRRVQDLSVQAQLRAVDEIAALTNGRFKSKEDLRRRTKVLDWLTEMGVALPKEVDKLSGKPKDSLRREIVQRWVESVDAEADQDETPLDPAGADGGVRPEDEEAPVEQVDLGLIAQVLMLRQSALRITDGKLKAAALSINGDERVRGLFVYWGAHTGRWAGRRIQVQNLPRPKEGVYTWGILDLLKATTPDPVSKVPNYYDPVKASLPIGQGPQYRFLTVDDAAGAMIRSLFVPDEGRVLVAADLANIEARVLAWLAGEEWLMKAFWADQDPYMAMAQQIFGPTSGWPVFLDPTTGEALPLKKHPYRQVGKVVELGSGYQLGARKFALYAAANGIDLLKVGTTAEACVTAYRRSHPAIAGVEAGEYEGRPYFRGGYWDTLNAGFVAAVESGKPQQVGPVVLDRARSGHLYCVLPSGRAIVYRDARVEDVTPGYARGTGKTVRSVTYSSPRGFRNHLYGGKETENIVQGASRDFIAHSTVRLEAVELPVVMHVHDEVVSVGDDHPDTLHRFMVEMTTCPAWAPDFPLDAEGSLLPRYAKSPPKGVKEVVYRNGKRHK